MDSHWHFSDGSIVHFLEAHSLANFGFDLESANELVQSGVQIPCRRKALTFRRVNTKGAFSNGNGPFGRFFVPLGEEEQRFT